MQKSFFRERRKILLIALGSILGCLLLIFIYVLLISPGKVAPFHDETGVVLENSVAEKTFVEINGVRQGMFIKGENISNPVLLFLHGGPGMPEYFLAEKFQTGLEKHFTVCYWDQRGAGLSYYSGMSADDITLPQLVADTAEIARYLTKRFEQEKIYLLGHSWGTFIGIKSAAANPELYYAYIGMSQLSNQVKSETIAYDYMIEIYREQGNQKKVNEFLKFDIHNDGNIINEYMMSSLRDNSMHELGIGTMRDMHSVITGIFLPSLNCRAYTLGEKINIWVAKAFLNKSTNLRQKFLQANLVDSDVDFEVPIYFFAGSYDYTVNYGLQREYFDKINAPQKGFYTFENSAHSPLFEEPKRFIDIVTNDIINGTANLADK